MLELDHEVTSQLLINDGHRDGTRLVLQEVPIVCGLQLYLQVWRTHTVERERTWLIH